MCDISSCESWKSFSSETTRERRSQSCCWVLSSSSPFSAVPMFLPFTTTLSCQEFFTVNTTTMRRISIVVARRAQETNCSQAVHPPEIEFQHFSPVCIRSLRDSFRKLFADSRLAMPSWFNAFLKKISEFFFAGSSVELG